MLSLSLLGTKNYEYEKSPSSNKYLNLDLITALIKIKMQRLQLNA